MTAIPRPRTSLGLLALASALLLLGPAGGGAAAPAAVAGAAGQLAIGVPPPAGQAALRDLVTGLRAVADRRDQRDRRDPTLLAVVAAAAGVALLLAGGSRLSAAGRAGHGRPGAAAPRGPPLPRSA